MTKSDDFEIQKFEFEKYRIEEEIKLRKRELAIKEKELKFKQTESEKITKKSFGTQLISPVGIAVVVALIGLIGTVINNIVNSRQARKKQQSDLIIKMSEISDEKQRASNLLFFEKGGFISLSKDYLQYLRNIAGLKENENIPPPSIISPIDTFARKFETAILKPYMDANNVWVIGGGHVLSKDELKSGVVLIGGKPISYSRGITEEQSGMLLNQDLNDISKGIDSMLKVNLSVNQRSALNSFVYSIGIDSFKNSLVLRLLNENRLKEIPNAMIGSQEQTPGIKRRRQLEIELWEKQ
jgi:GH24 family phage-related lysozyme (muramidase)